MQPVSILFAPFVSLHGTGWIYSRGRWDLVKGLVSLGCDYEGANSKYISVNIPPSVSLDEVRQYLIEKEATWEHADPTYDSLFPENA
jgi:hypothetical protein